LADKKDPLGGNINKTALDNLNEMQATMFNLEQVYKDLNKQAGIHTREIIEAGTQTTKLSKLIEHSKDIIGQIGVQIIKQKSYEGLINKFIINRSILQSKIDTLKEAETLQSTVLRDLEQEKLKISEKVKIREDDRQKMILQYNRLLAKRNALDKEGLLTKFKKQKYTNEFKKIYKEQFNNTKELVKLEEKKLKLQEEADKIPKFDVNTLILTKKQLEVNNESLATLQNEGANIEKSNKLLQRGNFFREIARKLGLTTAADFAKHKETFGLGGALTLGAIGLIALSIKGIVDLMFKADSQVTSMAKQLGISKDGALLVREEFEQVSKQSSFLNSNLNIAFASIENQVNAMTELNDQFGTGIRFSDKQVQDQIVLTKQMGLTADEAGDLQKYAMLNNTTAEKTADSISDQTVAFRKQTGVMLNARQVLTEVAKIEGALAVQYKNNPGLIAQAVLQVKKYGLTLEAAKNSASSLLDFESSISNELEAELLTGKQFNLEKARALALDGDSAGAATEMIKQIGTLANFQKLNVIQREGEAKMIGMSVDELSNAIVKQQLLRSLSAQQTEEYGKQLSYWKGQNKEAEFMQATRNATSGAELDASLSQLAAQQKFEETLNRIKETIGNIFTDNFLKSLQSLIQAFAEDIPRIINILHHPLTGWIGDLDPDTTAKPVGDSMLNSRGRMVISTPKGGIVPDKQDSIITTTNPGGLLNNQGSGNDQLNVKLDKLIEALSKGGNVYMDSRKVGTTQGLAYNSWG
jgi:hypothetical protein